MYVEPKNSEVRSLLGNVRLVTTNTTDTVVGATELLSTSIGTANILMSIGTDMATSMKKLKGYQIKGEEAEALEQLRERFPDLAIES